MSEKPGIVILEAPVQLPKIRKDLPWIKLEERLLFINRRGTVFGQARKEQREAESCVGHVNLGYTTKPRRE